jgi:prepilin-type N-terminal cleavage/methylation domain-containing protein
VKLFSKVKFKKSAGFTILELIIAIFILSFSILGVYNAFSVVIVLTHGASDRFTAAYLAQEGLEIVRNVRDNNWINAAEDWTHGIQDFHNGCEADYTTGTDVPGAKPFTPWVGGPGGGNYLEIDSNGFYGYDNGTETKFKRKIIITLISDYIIKVSVLVTWREKASILNPTAEMGSIEAEETLYNWY